LKVQKPARFEMLSPLTQVCFDLQKMNLFSGNGSFTFVAKFKADCPSSAPWIKYGSCPFHVAILSKTAAYLYQITRPLVF